MTNSSDYEDNMSFINWCIPYTGLVYLYGHLIPGIALFIFGCTFNPVALYYLAKSSNFRRSAYSYYFSAIAIFDLVRLTIWCFFLLLDYQIFRLNFYSFECPTQSFLESVASSISAWLTVALAVERCVAISEPLETYTDRKGKRARSVISILILASCLINSICLLPGFYDKRVYNEGTRTIICYYDTSAMQNATSNKTTSLLTSNIKRMYLLIITIIRSIVPFMLLFTTNIVLLTIARRNERKSRKSDTILVRHGRSRQITPMILFSSCILLLTVSPRYLLQFYVNFFVQSPHCSLTHFGMHLLKTLELCNYSFNVFVSVICGKCARRELIDMIFCRTTNTNSIFNTPTKRMSSRLSNISCQSKSKFQLVNQSNPSQRPLITKPTDCH